jgi:Cys-tRNA(Pro)/Cys-tRNA(Cys) deacylase
VIGASPDIAELEARLRLLYKRARLIRHADLPGPIATPLAFAAAVGCQPMGVAKTLLMAAEHRQTAVEPHRAPPFAAVVLAAPDLADLGAVADTLGAERARLATHRELGLLGLAPGAVSPFWMGHIPVYIDVALLALTTVYVNAGRRGIDVEIAPADLAELTKATVGRLARSPHPR